MPTLEGKNVVITGGTGALGSAVVRAFHDRGAICHIPSRSTAEIPGIEPQERLLVTPGIDLTSEKSVENYYATLRPGLSASIHVAGGFAMAPVTDTSLADFDEMLRMNTITAFLCCREAARNMRAGKKGGRIVNIASQGADQATGGMVAYVVSKAAVVALTRALAEELRADDILVNAVLPSIIDTPANRSGMPQADFASWPRPDQIAHSVVFLGSPDNEITSGAILPAYGNA